jgi:hypothetical protein
MSILKYAILGAAVAFGISQLTKRREDGSSILDDLTERSPDLMNKAKDYAAQAVDHLSQSLKERLS